MKFKSPAILAFLSVSALALSLGTGLASTIHTEDPMDPPLLTSSTTNIEEDRLGDLESLLKTARGDFGFLLQTLKPLVNLETLLEVNPNENPNYPRNIEQMLNEQEMTLLDYIRKTAPDAWKRKANLGAFIKNLSTDHKQLITEYYTLLNILTQCQESLTTEQGVSAQLRLNLAEARILMDNLREEITQNTLKINREEESSTQMTLYNLDENTSLIPSHSQGGWQTKTVLALFAGGVTLGVGIGTLVLFFINTATD